MATYRRVISAFALGCLFWCCLAPHCAALGTIQGQNDGNTGIFSAGGRHLQQISNPCPHQWAYDNFTALLDACPVVTNVSEAPSYPKQACCASVADMLCPYATLVNDPTSQCATSFWDTLEAVRNYTNGFFGFVCTNTNNPNGIDCPSNTSSPTTVSSTPNSFSHKRDLHSFGLTLILTVAIFEFLVLCF